MSGRVYTSVQNWLAASRLRAFCFNLLWIGFPLSVFGYIVRWHRWELLALIVLVSVVPPIMRRSDRDIPQNVPK